MTAQTGDREGSAFCVIFKTQNGVDDFRDGAGFVPGPVDIKLGDGANEITSIKMVFLDISLIDKLTGGITVNESWG